MFYTISFFVSIHDCRLRTSKALTNYVLWNVKRLYFCTVYSSLVGQFNAASIIHRRFCFAGGSVPFLFVCNFIICIFILKGKSILIFSLFSFGCIFTFCEFSNCGQVFGMIAWSIYNLKKGIGVKIGEWNEKMKNETKIKLDLVTSKIAVCLIWFNWP